MLLLLLLYNWPGCAGSQCQLFADAWSTLEVGASEQGDLKFTIVIMIIYSLQLFYNFSTSKQGDGDLSFVFMTIYNVRLWWFTICNYDYESKLVLFYNCGPTKQGDGDL